MSGFDHWIMRVLIPVIESTAGTDWARVATLAGNGGLQATAIVLLFMVSKYFKKKKLEKCSVCCLIGLVTSGISVQLLKFAVGRGRPGMKLPAWTFKPWTLENSWHSFPSGHAASSFAIATVLTAFYPRLWWLSYALALFIAVGRVLGEAHFPTDVLAGAFLGGMCGCLCVFVIRRNFY